MDRVCLLCDRTAPSCTLFCQQPLCQAERAPLVLAYGDRLGDVEVIRPLVVLRSSVIYEAAHLQQRVFLKVAHLGQHNEQRLLREAELLQKLQASGQQRSVLPKLVSPYTRATAQPSLIGRAMLSDKLVSYVLFAYIPGEPLQDVLKKHPQLWIDHIGWITIELASAVALVHGAHHLHLALGPECAFVHFAGDEGVPRVTLVDLGLATTLRQTTDNRTYVEHWYPEAVRSSGTAPELTSPVRVNKTGYSAGTQTDVYGLGLVLYEMLASAPPFSRSQIAAAAVYDRIAVGQITPLNRTDVPLITDLALKMLSPNPADRPLDARTIVEEIKSSSIGMTPIIRQSRWLAPERIFRIAATVLLVAFLIALFLSLREFLV